LLEQNIGAKRRLPERKPKVPSMEMTGGRLVVDLIMVHLIMVDLMRLTMIDHAQ
jgi:hypothetical protein